jgi:glycolate oxidase subunit GlcD
MPPVDTKLDKLSTLLSSPEAIVRPVGPDSDFRHDATEYAAEPCGVVLAKTKDDVLATVNFCRDHGIPIAARGAGTGLSGGCVPIEHALVLSTKQIDHIRVDADRKRAVCGPGAVTKHLMDAAAAHGLTYPPDPASYEECSLGGNVAENAGGLRCKRFGVTRDYVIGLEAVLADGSVLRTGILNGERGFSLGDVLVGSEGTLAILTEIVVQLIDSPGRGETLLVTFDKTEDAARTVSDLTGAGIVPTVLEFIDGDAAACANEYETTEGIDQAGAILLIETSDRNAREQSETIRNFCNRNHATYLRQESDPDKVEMLWKVRRNVSKAVKSLAKHRVSEDVAVPNSKIPDMVAFVSELNRTSRLRINCWGHAGDGNIHINIMVMSDAPEEMAEIEPLLERAMRKILEFGGTLTGEHGIGLAKRNYIGLEFDRPTLNAMARIKTVFDPDFRFNPGKLFPDFLFST